MKKIIVSFGAVAMTFAMAGTAFAAQSADRGGYNSIKNSKSTTVVSSNEASVTNMVGSTANTGLNSIATSHGDVKYVTVTTGAATSSATVQNTLNNNNVNVDAQSCGCEINPGNQVADRGGANKVKVKDDASVLSTNGSQAANVVSAGSSTGMNGIMSHHGDIMYADMTAGMAMGTTQVATLSNFNAVIVKR